MAAPILTAARLRELVSYDPSTGLFSRRVWTSSKAYVGKSAGSLNHGYVLMCVDRRRYAAHRLAWLYVHGTWPDGEIDHINGDRADNRIENLRDVTPTVNRQNQRAAPSHNKISGLLGAHRSRGRWAAHIKVQGKMLHLGVFATADEAHAAYVAAKRRLHPGCTI